MIVLFVIVIRVLNMQNVIKLHNTSELAKVESIQYHASIYVPCICKYVIQ